MKTKMENRMCVLINRFVIVVFLLVAVIGKGQEWEMKGFNAKPLTITYKKVIILNAIPVYISNKNNYFTTVYLDSTVSFSSSGAINYTVKIDSILVKEIETIKLNLLDLTNTPLASPINLRFGKGDVFTKTKIYSNGITIVPTFSLGDILSSSIPISASDLPYQKLFRNRNHYKFQFHKQKTFYLGLNWNPSFGNRSLQINAPQFQEYDALTQRNANEYARFFYSSFAGQIGYNFNYSHVVFAQYQHSQKGFNYVDNSKAVDSSGIYNIKKSASSADYQFNGFALGYKYINNHSSLINPIFESALHFNWATHLQNLGRNYFACSGKLGVGLSINICSSTDFNILPNVIYDFNTIKASQLNARFYNLGIDFGLGFRIGNQKNK